MAGEERDARLILRAEDRASRTFDTVAASIKNVRKEIAEQAKAAAGGVADLAAMERQLNELKKAGDDLVQGQSLIRQFDGLEESVTRAEARVKSATATLEAYRAKVGQNPTDNQATQLDKKAGSVDRAQASLDRLNAKLADVTTRMGTVGISTGDTTREFMRIAAAATETAQGIAQVKNQMDEFPAAAARAAAAAQEFKAAQEFGAKDTSRLNPDQFAYIQSLDGAKAKLAALADIEQREAVAARTYITEMSARWQMQLRSLSEVERQTKQTAAATAKAAADESGRVADLAAFRQVGTDAAEAAVKTERYAASIQNLGNDFQSFSQTVRTALGGTQTALQDVGQALLQIDASAEVLNSPKVKINELQAASGKLSIAIATLDRTARNIDGFRIAQQAVGSARASFAEARAEVLRLAAAMKAADAPSETLAADMVRAERALDQAGKAMQRDRNEAIKLGDALRKAGVDTNNLEAEMKRFEAAANRAGTASAGFQGKSQGKGGFLGLNPFELQNLGYQVNDVFTQLGSGTPILQVLAQQGGQVVQLFRGLGGALLRAFPLIAGITLLLSPFIGAMMQAAQATDALRTANLLLAGSGETLRANVAEFANASIVLQNMGASAKDATAVLVTLRDSGLDPSSFAAFSAAVSDAARGGTELTETAKLLSDALTGGSKEVEALNDKFRILTPTEEAQVVAMIESGKESEARRIIYEKFEATADRIAAQASGTWSGAFSDLKLAFNNFTSAISKTDAFGVLRESFRLLIFDAKAAKQEMADLTYFFNYAAKRGVFGAIKDAFTGPGGPNGKPTAAQAAAARFANAGGRPDGGPGAPPKLAERTNAGSRAVRRQTEAYEDQQRSLKSLGREETAALARRRALAAAGPGLGSKDREDVARLAERTALLKFDDDAAKAAERARKKGASAAKSAESARNRAAKAAETLANQRRAIEEQLARDLDGIDKKVAEGQNASIEQRRAAVLETYTGLFQKIEEAKRKGVTQIDGKSLAAYEAQVRAQIAILQNNAELKAREEQINDVIKQRADAIKGIEDQLSRGDLTPQQALLAFEETISRFGPQITKMNSDALAFAKSLRGAVPDPRLEAMIAKFERLGQQNSGGGDATLLKGLRLDVVGDEGKKLEQMVQERQALVQAETLLVELGVKPRQDAQAAIEAAYSRTNPIIQAQIDKMRELLAVFKDDPAMATFYDTWIAKLEGVAAASTYVDARFTQLKQGFDNIISQNAVAAIDTIAQSFANLALSQQGAVDTLLQIGAAFLQFIASTIIGIAKLIIQMIILDAVQKITGIPVGALLKFMNATGLHTGGVVGQEQTFGRRVPSIAFANAPRYHGGGVAGFAPDEVPAILKRNEEVLTQNDPRHRFNQTGSSTGDASESNAGTRQVLVLDPAELANALAGAAGEKVVMTHIRRNQTTLKQLTS